MARQRPKSLITFFTSDGDLLAVLSPNGVVKIWSTHDESLFAEWNKQDGDPTVSYTCLACSFVGKKRRKERSTFLLVLGTNDGDILAVDVLSGESKWKATGRHPGGLAGLAFSNKGHSLHVVGTNGMASEMNSETGELIGEFKASKEPIASSSFLCEKKFFALASDEVWVLNLENGEEVMRLSDKVGPVQCISLTDDARIIITSGYGEKHLQLWRCYFGTKIASRGPVLNMRHRPIAIECKNSSNEEGCTFILAVSDFGVAYLWTLNATSQDEVMNPTKITVKVNKADADQQNSVNVKKSRSSIIAARLHDFNTNGQVTVLVSYGSIDTPQFSLVNINKPGEDIVIAAEDATETVQEDWVAIEEVSEAVTASAQNKKGSKKRAASDPDLATARGVADTGPGEDMDGVLDDDNQNEPTMGEKLANLNLLDDNKTKTQEVQESSPTKPPSADSVTVLLKQALHADDRALLLECLYNQDKKVIANSIALLKPSDVLKLLHSLVSIIQLRGAVLVCALPWLQSLLLQHASGIMSQESSISALNTLYQLIESRVSTFQSVVQISSCIDLLFSGIVDDGVEESNAVIPLIYEDKDSSDEEESEDAMETDQENGEEIEDEKEAAVDGMGDLEGNDTMSE